MAIEMRDDRQYRALLGISEEKHKKLVETFEQVYAKGRQEAYLADLAAGKRQRKIGGGQKGKLPTGSDKINFILYYYKRYPTFDDLGSRFHMSRGRAHEWVQKLTPYLALTLIELQMLPEEDFENAEALKQACQGLDRIIIDVTERAHQRPADNKSQRDYYSGKKTPYHQKHGD